MPARRARKPGGGAPEKRADPNETSGDTYTKKAFLDHYGEAKGQKLWDKAGGQKAKAEGGKTEGKTEGKKKKEDQKKEPRPIKPGELEIGYWDIRGLAAPLRMMAAYKGLEFTDKQYVLKEKEGGGYDASDWFAEAKPELLKSNPLINLPYVKLGKQVVTQSNPCLIWLGEKLGLRDNVTNQQVIAEIFDVRNNLVDLCYPFKMVKTEGEFKPAFEKHSEALNKGSYTKLDDMLGRIPKKEGAKYFAGRSPAACDFAVFEIVDQHEIIAEKLGISSALADLPNLSAFYANFKELPQLKEYFAGDKYALPLNNRMAFAK